MDRYKSVVKTPFFGVSEGCDSIVFTRLWRCLLATSLRYLCRQAVRGKVEKCSDIFTFELHHCDCKSNQSRSENLTMRK